MSVCTFFSDLDIPSLLDYFPICPMKNFLEMVLILKRFTLHLYFLKNIYFAKVIGVDLLKVIIYT